MSDLSRKAVPDKGSLNRERPVTKALKFPFAQDVLPVEFMYLAFTRMPGESYRRQLRSLL